MLFLLKSIPALTTLIQLPYPKPKFSAQLQADIIEFVLANSNLVIPAAVTDLAIDDPDDLKIVSCAVAAKAHCIISGDPHLLDLGSYRTISILNPAAFISSFDRSFQPVPPVLRLLESCHHPASVLPYFNQT